MKISNSIQKSNGILLYAFLLSLFPVLFMWRFWQHGMNILGINSVAYGLGIIGFFWYVKRNEISKKSWLWVAPLIIIVVSFGIYANTFTKGISLFLLPILFFVFSTQEVHKIMFWSRSFVSEMLFAFIDYLGSIFLSLGEFIFKENLKLIPNLSGEKRSVLKQVSLGVLILFLLSFFVVIPLLSSADSAFGDVFKNIMNYLGNVLESFFKANLISRIFVLSIGMMLLLGYAIYWTHSRESNVHPIKREFVKKNPIMVSIILSGTLALYFIFIGLQIKTLFLGELPVQFNQTVYFVKTGFWQLFLLTIINIFFYMGIYGKSDKTVQRILGIFTFASLLLILSGAHRTYLYVANYGLSYEKFYALYTVIFCVGVFMWFSYLFISKKENPQIFKKLAFAALWMYTLTTIIPLDRTILAVNFKLTQQPGSRVDINELRMLGFDAIPFIEKNFDQFIELAQTDNQQHLQGAAMDYYQRENVLNLLKMSEVNVPSNINNEVLSKLYVETIWKNWVKEQISDSQNLNYFNHLSYNSTYSYDIEEKKKRWYEKTILELVYRPKTTSLE